MIILQPLGLDPKEQKFLAALRWQQDQIAKLYPKP
ncbi:MAG: phage portal protein [bacterium]|nr:phage portal protein [bacterium]